MPIATERSGYSDVLDLHLKKNLIRSVAIATKRRGYSDVLDLHFFKNLIQSMDTATERHGYSDGKAWIQRRQGVDTETPRRGYRDSQAWIQRRLGVDIATDYTLTKYRTLSLLRRKLGVVSIATELFPRKKNT